jgi:hypothetical protein
MRNFISLIVMVLVASNTIAAETEIIGKSLVGQKYEFSYGFPISTDRIVDFPLPPDARSEPRIQSGVRIHAKRTATQPAIHNESQCAVLTTKNALFISCSLQPKNVISGVVYRYKGINNAGDGMYSCVMGCSKGSPKTLLEVVIPRGG